MRRRNMVVGGGTLALAGLVAGRSAASGSAFYVPAEEEPHQRTFMQWPASRKVYRDPVFLEMVQTTIAQIANTIAAFEPVTMLAAKEHHNSARRKLSGAVELWDIATEDLWCRDTGPIFVVNGDGSLSVSHIQFNGWGEKQINEKDSQIARRVAERLGLKLLASGLRGEGGGIEQDGHGLLMAHESSWVAENRNPGLSRDRIEAKLLRAYGAERLIWSKGVKGRDITDYHIDSLARFSGPGRVLINLPREPDMGDPFHVAALETHEALMAAGLEIEVIPEPDFRRVDHIDFVASYANYYVCNGAVIAAEFGDAVADKLAREALSRHYPNREIVTLNVDLLGELGGGIHCATQQMPAV